MPQNFANPDITQVFVLMLENRSFDHMLGFSGLKGTDPVTGSNTSINGVNPVNANTYLGTSYPVTNNADNSMPFDPGHEFPDVVEQLCGAGVQYGGGTYPLINNSGFVSNYATTRSSGEGGAAANFGEIMKCYNSAVQLPIITALAENFAVCDNWLASLPGPTWPNRFFVHAASSGGLDHSPTIPETTDWEFIDGFSFPNGSIYQLLDNHKNDNKGWRLYRGVSSPLIGSLPCVAALKGIQLKDTHRYEDFQSDINGNYPYSYTFIEPNYGDTVNSSYAGGQSQHPMDDVRNGEALIKSTYEAIRNSPLWLSSLLIITYDEHGGFYDHVAPPAATAPGDTAPNSKFNKYGFDFQQYGVRVPALVISAYTTKNLISHQVYDHSSVPATIEALFNLPALTRRDDSANNLTSLANLGTARTDTPATLPPVSAIAGEQPAAMQTRIVQPEDAASADSGNLPGFLHIALKAKREQEVNETNRTMMKGDFITHVTSKADARKYLEASLPGLLTTSQSK